MFLSKHKSGYYYIYYTNPSTNKRTCKSTGKKIKKDALTVLSKFQKTVDTKKSFPTFPITLKRFRWEFLKYSESVHSVNTTNTIRTSLNGVLNYFGNMALANLTTTKIQEYLVFKIRTVSKYQARKDLINLSSSLTKAVVDNYLVSNPCQGIKRIKIPEKQPKFFTESEFESLIQCIDEKDLKDLVIFAVNTGLRQMELLTLQWDQINFRDKILTLDNRNHLTKSKKVRSLPLNISSLQILIERERYKTSDLVFTLRGKSISQDQISKVFKKYVLKVDINPKLNFHSLRHTFASWLVQRGVSIYHVSKLLGHADIKTTQIYSHVRAEDLMESINLLNK